MPSPMGNFYKLGAHPDEQEESFHPKKIPHKSPDDKNCTACTDFQSWMKTRRATVPDKECPLNKSELGNRTWGFLHTMAAYFPVKPSAQQSQDMAQFLRLFSQFYPCPTCANDFTRLMNQNPPKTASQEELKHWLCWAHNEVNKKLGKPKFDCAKLDERWKYGWKDGSCN